jgi:hypothetical protein
MICPLVNCSSLLESKESKNWKEGVGAASKELRGGAGTCEFLRPYLCWFLSAGRRPAGEELGRGRTEGSSFTAGTRLGAGRSGRGATCEWRRRRYELCLLSTGWGYGKGIEEKRFARIDLCCQWHFVVISSERYDLSWTTFRSLSESCGKHVSTCFARAV